MPPASALFVTPTMPAAAGNGLAMRAGLLLEGLAKVFDVDVLVVPVFSGSAAPGEFVRARTRRVSILDLEPEADPLAELTKRLHTPEGRARARALHPLPTLCQTATTAAAARVAAWADGQKLVVAMRTYLCPFLDVVLDRAGHPPIVIDVDDIESTTQRALGHGVQAERYERVEEHYLPLADLVTTCSQDDAAELTARLSLDAVSTVPNAVGVPPEPLPRRREIDLLFVGNLSYEPNVDAACWLCNSVLPLLGDVRVALVGSRPTEAVRALRGDPRVTLAADVDSVSAWYEAASVAVVPVRLGGGSRIKLIEAFAHRRPVVATTVGAHGMPWPASETPVVLADGAAQFADACRMLLDDPALAQRRAQAGQDLVRSYASIDVVATQIAKTMSSACLRAAGSGR